MSPQNLIANPVSLADVKFHKVMIEVYEANIPEKSWYYILIDVVNHPPVFIGPLKNMEMALNKVLKYDLPRIFDYEGGKVTVSF